ncbi:MAG: LysM peptidoglycan-binding domain-containing protein [bacterium]
MKKYLLPILILIFVLSSFTASAYMPSRTYQKDDQFRHIIAEGDTLYSLAQLYKTTVKQILNLNPEINPEQLKVGDIIRININPDLNYYVFQSGDSLWEISQQHDYQLYNLINYNRIYAPETIKPGEVIVLPPKKKTVRAVFYYLKYTTKEAFLVPEVRQVTFTDNLYQDVLTELIKGSGKLKKVYMPLPYQTEILNVKVKNKIARINFSEDIKRANVGAEGEKLLIQSITNTLTEYEAIEGVQILIKGKKDTIGGHIGLDQTFYRNLENVRY